MVCFVWKTLVCRVKRKWQMRLMARIKNTVTIVSEGCGDKRWR